MENTLSSSVADIFKDYNKKKKSISPKKSNDKKSPEHKKSKLEFNIPIKELDIEMQCKLNNINIK